MIVIDCNIVDGLLVIHDYSSMINHYKSADEGPADEYLNINNFLYSLFSSLLFDGGFSFNFLSTNQKFIMSINTQTKLKWITAQRIMQTANTAIFLTVLCLHSYLSVYTSCIF